MEVRIGGVTVAETTRRCCCSRPGLPTRYYFPKVDVRLDLLRAVVETTACPYKGIAGYYSVLLPDGTVVDDIAWVYPKPIVASATIENHISFFNDRVDVFVDGELQPRPVTHWS